LLLPHKMMNLSAEQTSSRSAPSAAPLWLNGAVTVAAIAAMVLLRLVFFPNRMTPIGYGVPLILFVWLGDWRFLWFCAAAFVAVSAIEIFYVLPVHNPIYGKSIGYAAAAFAMVVGDLLIITLVVQWLVSARSSLLRQNDQLNSTNEELALRGEEIVRQNEELQSQTEELERQTEELRVSNDELTHREKTLENLLSLSRALVVEMGHSEMMDQICRSLAELINGPGLATAILEQKGDEMVVLCHHGFGEAGIRADRIPYRSSFASLIIDRARTGYLEDVSRRPDLEIPQPAEGPPMQAVLGAPLRVRGRGVGSLEVYCRDKRSWTDEQITLVESLAAQTAISLESASLFEQIEHEQQRLDAVLNTAPIGLAITDGGWSRVTLNPAASQLFSAPPGTPISIEELSRTNRVFRDGQPLSLDQWPAARAHQTGENIFGDEIEVFTPSGRRLHLLVGASPVRDRHGNQVGAVSSFADITALKMLQRELDFRRREAEEASVRKSRFLAAVSHDIRTPANAISLLAELMQRTATTPALLSEVPEIATDLKRSAMTLVDLVSDVLDLTRFDSGRIDLHETEFPLTDMIREECRGLLPVAREKGLAFDCAILEQNIVVRTDRVKLSRILGNLINNAIKFTDRGGITVSAQRQSGGEIRIDVADTGSGIAVENQERVFDEFFQLRAPGRDSSKGSGLGLAICRRLTEAMGGKITVKSTLGEGSTFSVILPATAVLPT
jgi:signal transduction histidine kinase